MIVITAPTGNIGHQVVDRVLAADEPVRVVVRDPARLNAGVRERAEVVQGSHGDPEAVARALDGADALFWLPPPNHHAATLDEVYSDFARPAVEAIRAYGVKHVVSVSALGRGTAFADRAGHATATLALDDRLAETGAAFRSLNLPSFMDNLLRQAQVIKEQGVFFNALSPDRALPTVATGDIAAVAARLLLDRSWSGREDVPVLGPEDLSQNDTAAVISNVLGFPVRYQQVPTGPFKERFLSAGASEAIAQGMLEMAIAKDGGLDSGITRTPQHAVDTPTTLRQWCEDVLKPAVKAA
ncbi:NAD(P)H-binding protein [Streptomyces sp. CBMA29]|uniref:NAD(P)H-binding protein n=1 Tax=Streptomyces sp. CBMA29 TaxID=1896314 RepID=UPI001661983F|nr:NAD(P)H-binding protein [Streptomyces sp. CBMA29]MBD0735810.1 NmrA family transcriptional regulator [Streptomyces sp. CBMA29]